MTSAYDARPTVTFPASEPRSQLTGIQAQQCE